MLDLVLFTQFLSALDGLLLGTVLEAELLPLGPLF